MASTSRPRVPSYMSRGIGMVSAPVNGDALGCTAFTSTTAGRARRPARRTPPPPPRSGAMVRGAKEIDCVKDLAVPTLGGAFRHDEAAGDAMVAESYEQPSLFRTIHER